MKCSILPGIHRVERHDRDFVVFPSYAPRLSLAVPLKWPPGSGILTVSCVGQTAPPGLAWPGYPGHLETKQIMDKLSQD